MIERDFDLPFAAKLAIREKQIQQNYRPVIAVHKWFARRPGTLFRCLLLSEFCDKPLSDSYYKPHDYHGKRIADPFMGGGTPILEANRIGLDVLGCDINPMAYWIVQEELQSLNISEYRKCASKLRYHLARQIGPFYQTTCTLCGRPADAKYFLWVKALPCDHCGSTVKLFPGYLLSEDRRHPRNVLVCSQCGELNEVEDIQTIGRCSACKSQLALKGPAVRGYCDCPFCGKKTKYPAPRHGPPRHSMFALEYYCPICKPHHKGRFFKKPDEDDIAGFEAASQKWSRTRPTYVPDDEIPAGDESDRLHKWGYRAYRDLFNSRQLLALELTCRLIKNTPDQRICHALATNLSDLLRYQNLLCRYDTMALKSLDIFSVHGFPVGLIQCESNFLGIPCGDNGVNIGSGGWLNITEKYAKAKDYCNAPFEFKHNGTKKELIRIHGEWIGEEFDDDFMGFHDKTKRLVEIRCDSAKSVKLPKGSLDGVFTDPPYFGNVQYAELMDFCYVWLRRLVDDDAFRSHSTRDADELTGNVTMDRGLEHFASGLSQTLINFTNGMKTGAPLVFTYHHNRLEAYYPVVVALLDTGLICTASIPCPAEMAASIHIHGTDSSIIDSVLVARDTDTTPKGKIARNLRELTDVVLSDVKALAVAGVKAGLGDIRCITYGHIARLAAWNLHADWDRSVSVGKRLSRVADWVSAFGDVSTIEDAVMERV